MIQGQKVLGLVVARGGSKGVPRKNLRLLGGRPLIAWTIEAAKASSCLDALVISTDDPEIAETARQNGCEVPFLRPAELAGDTVGAMPVVMHAIRTLEEAGRHFDWIVLLQPTSPFRSASDIDAAVKLCFDGEAPACVSLVEADKSPWWMVSLNDAGRMETLMESTAVRRQDLPVAYAYNGAVYVARISWLAQSGSFIAPETLGYVMPRDRSLDIDGEWDFQLAEAVYSLRSRS